MNHTFAGHSGDETVSVETRPSHPLFGAPIYNFEEVQEVMQAVTTRRQEPHHVDTTTRDPHTPRLSLDALPAESHV